MLRGKANRCCCDSFKQEDRFSKEIPKKSDRKVAGGGVRRSGDSRRSWLNSEHESDGLSCAFYFDEAVPSMREANIRQDPCGKFCRYLRPQEEREIIRELLPEKNQDPTKLNGALDGVVERKFVICARWWRQWCDYVNLEQKLAEYNRTRQAASGG